MKNKFILINSLISLFLLSGCISKEALTPNTLKVLTNPSDSTTLNDEEMEIVLSEARKNLKDVSMMRYTVNEVDDNSRLYTGALSTLANRRTSYTQLELTPFSNDVLVSSISNSVVSTGNTVYSSYYSNSNIFYINEVPSMEENEVPSYQISYNVKSTINNQSSSYSGKTVDLPSLEYGRMFLNQLLESLIFDESYTEGIDLFSVTSLKNYVLTNNGFAFSQSSRNVYATYYNVEVDYVDNPIKGNNENQLLLATIDNFQICYAYDMASGYRLDNFQYIRSSGYLSDYQGNINSDILIVSQMTKNIKINYGSRDVYEGEIVPYENVDPFLDYELVSVNEAGEYTLVDNFIDTSMSYVALYGASSIDGYVAIKHFSLATGNYALRGVDDKIIPYDDIEIVSNRFNSIKPQIINNIEYINLLEGEYEMRIYLDQDGHLINVELSCLEVTMNIA